MVLSASEKNMYDHIISTHKLLAIFFYLMVIGNAVEKY